MTRPPQDEQLATQQRLYRIKARRRTEQWAIKQVNRQVRAAQSVIARWKEEVK